MQSCRGLNQLICRAETVGEGLAEMRKQVAISSYVYYTRIPEINKRQHLRLYLMMRNSCGRKQVSLFIAKSFPSLSHSDVSHSSANWVHFGVVRHVKKLDTQTQYAYTFSLQLPPTGGTCRLSEGALFFFGGGHNRGCQLRQ